MQNQQIMFPTLAQTHYNQIDYGWNHAYIFIIV